MSSMGKDFALDILKHCFPEADTIRIIHMTLYEGDRHLSSDVNRFIVEYEQGGGTQRKHLIMKVPTTSEFSTTWDKLNAYDREIHVYETLLPQINKYLDKSLAPAHLYTTDSKILVLEDLGARDYKSGEKLPLLNLAQSEAVMKTFAHFHAASRKLYEAEPSIIKNIPVPCWEGFDFEKVIQSWETIIVGLLGKKGETHLIPKVKTVGLFLNRVHNDKIRGLLDESKYQFLVLNHGDGRKDNFLFKHTAKNEVKVQFIDYQVCHWSSPGKDIIYFLITSVLTDVIRANLDDLIDGYLCELNMKLKTLECASTYNRADFDEDFKNLRYFLFTFFYISCAFVSPLSREQLEHFFAQSGADTSYLHDLCLNDENFVNFVYGWIKYFEKSKIFDEF